MYTMEYCSAIKNKVMPFAAAWIDLNSAIISEVKPDWEGQLLQDIDYMCNLKKKNYTNELTYKTYRLTDIEKERMVIKGEKGKTRSLGLTHIHYYI